MLLPITITACSKDICFVLENDIKEVNLQLLPCDLSKSNKDWVEFLNKLKGVGAKVVTIHSPFTVDPSTGANDAYYIENYSSMPNDFEAIFRTANSICNFYQQAIPTVFHSNCHSYALQRLMSVQDKFNVLLSSYPLVDLCVENTSLGYGDLRLLDKEYELIPTLIKTFGKGLVRPIHSTLDVCHAIMNIRLQEHLCADLPKMEVRALADYFEKFGEDCHVVHLANCTSLGLKSTTHGTAFLHRDTELLKGILLCVRKYTPNAKVVLEVSESDYTNRPAVLKTLKTLKSINI